MASKRMFDKAIMETDNFLNISLTAKALYFLLGMEADDEGFISPKRVLRLYGGEPGDLKNLIDSGLIIPFQSGVVVITDWNQNNWLDNRRIKPTQYQKEKKMLILTSGKKYLLSIGSASAQLEESRGEERRIVNTLNSGKPEGEEISIQETEEDGFSPLKRKNKPKVVHLPPFSQEIEVIKLMVSPSKVMNIVGHYIRSKGLRYENWEQWKPDLLRFLRSAKSLKGYSGEQIEITFEYCKRKWPDDWTIETVVKWISEANK